VRGPWWLPASARVLKRLGLSLTTILASCKRVEECGVLALCLSFARVLEYGALTCGRHPLALINSPGEDSCTLDLFAAV
jgi:hypothetical protein